MVTGAAALTAVMLATGPASAYVFSIDRFHITKNGGQFFDDNFDAGGPPPSAPNFIASGNPTSYNTQGIFGEAGGRATMDVADAALVASGITGDPLLRHRARLLSDNQPLSVSTNGLKTDDTFVVEALFDLTVPAANGEYFYLRLTDASATGGNDILELRVRIGNSGNPIVQFRELDTVLDTTTVLANDGIPTTGGVADHEQIMLRLSKLDFLSNTITASYEYFDGGVGQGNASFADVGDTNTSSNIFRGEEWTRAEFGAVQPVPAPASLALFGLGLAGLGWTRRWRKAM